MCGICIVSNKYWIVISLKTEVQSSMCNWYSASRQLKHSLEQSEKITHFMLTRRPKRSYSVTVLQVSICYLCAIEILLLWTRCFQQPGLTVNWTAGDLCFRELAIYTSHKKYSRMFFDIWEIIWKKIQIEVKRELSHFEWKIHKNLFIKMLNKMYLELVHNRLNKRGRNKTA